MKHPLLNSASSHYDKTGEPTAIELLEDELTLDEAIGWCKGNIFKYIYRMDRKGQKESDLKKIATYKAYKDLLCHIKYQLRTDASMTVKYAYHVNDYEMVYT